MMTSLTQLLCRAGWAPAAVLILHAVVAKTRFREPLDFAMHFSGGAAMAYFLFEAQRCYQGLLGNSTPFARYLLAFALACTVGMFWEFGEWSSDAFLHTHIQKSLSETMSDLLADVVGAIAALMAVALVRFRGNSPEQSSP